MTAIRNTLEDTQMKQDIGYGAIDDTTNPETETSKTPTRTTYGILLFVMSVVLVVAGAGAAGATHPYLRYDTTASIVVSSERDDTASSKDPCAHCTAHQECKMVHSEIMGMPYREFKCVDVAQTSCYQCVSGESCCFTKLGAWDFSCPNCEGYSF